MIELFPNDMSTCSLNVGLSLANKELDQKIRHLSLRADDQKHPEFLV